MVALGMVCTVSDSVYWGAGVAVEFGILVGSGRGRVLIGGTAYRRKSFSSPYERDELEDSGIEMGLGSEGWLELSDWFGSEEREAPIG